MAVKDVNFTVARGELVGLLGPNGAGKTTTLKCVLGLVEPTAGEIRVFGYDARVQRPLASRLMAAVLEGSRNVFWRMSVRENLDYFALLHGLSPRALRAERERLIEALGLGPHADIVLGGLALIFKRVELSFQIWQFLFIGFLVIPWEASFLVRFVPFSWAHHLLQEVMVRGVRLMAVPGELAGAAAVSLGHFLLAWIVFRRFVASARRLARLGHY